MQDAENEISKVKANERKGSYGDTSGKSANALYKNYKQYIESTGKTPLPFQEWIKWAKEKGIVDKSQSADGNDVEDLARQEMAKVQDASKRTKKIIGGVIIGGMAIYLGYRAYVYFNNKQKTNGVV